MRVPTVLNKLATGGTGHVVRVHVAADDLARYRAALRDEAAARGLSIATRWYERVRVLKVWVLS